MSNWSKFIDEYYEDEDEFYLNDAIIIIFKKHFGEDSITKLINEICDDIGCEYELTDEGFIFRRI